MKSFLNMFWKNLYWINILGLDNISNSQKVEQWNCSYLPSIWRNMQKEEVSLFFGNGEGGLKPAAHEFLEWKYQY